MRLRCRPVLWFALAAILAVGMPHSTHASTLPYIPLDHWVTPLISEAIGRGILPGLSLADRPYGRDAVARALRTERTLADSTQRDYTQFEGWLIDRIEAEVDPAEAQPPAAFSKLTGDASLGFGLEARAEAETGEDQRRFGKDDVKGIALPYVGFTSGRGLAGGLRFRIDTDGGQVPNFNGRPWRHGWTGDERNAYLLVQLGAADVLLGRDDLRWGASEKSTLLLSSYAPPFDQIGLRVHVGAVTASSFFSSLDDMTLDAPVAEAPGDTIPAGTKILRHISGHRIRWQVSHTVALGVAETVVYGGKDRGLEAEYTIPVSIYYAGQWNKGKNDNALLSFTGELRPIPSMELYGELMIDDVQFEHKSPADKEPFEGGFLLGQRFYNPFGLDGGLLRIEWAKVQPFTYNQVLPWNRYIYQGQPIGFDLGSDAQAIDVEFRHWASEKVTWSMGYRLEERGQTRLTDPWPVPVTGPDSLNSFPEFDHVPTGTVERRNKISSELWIHPRPGIDLRLGGGYIDVKNLENVKGDGRVEWFFQGSLRLNWSSWLRPGED
jgi:capsule assembly protein Wzi